MIAIIGFGISGMLAYLELLKQNVNPKDIIIFDLNFNGGDLSTLWSGINSNTTWKQVQVALATYPQCKEFLDKSQLDPEKITNLIELPLILWNSVQHIIKKSEVHLTNVDSISYTEKIWSIQTSIGIFKTEKVILCYGGVPKTMDIPGKWIPLEIALDLPRLKRHIKQGDLYVVFGLSHSGTLIIRNLSECGASVIGIYKTKEPFEYKRDAKYRGIKQESEITADAILNGSYPNVKLVHSSDLATVIRSVDSATAMISAIGFAPRQLDIFVNSTKIDSKKYSEITAELIGCPSCYGFGMAFPGKTTMDGIVYEDISLPSFQEQISRCIPSIILDIKLEVITS